MSDAMGETKTQKHVATKARSTRRTLCGASLFAFVFFVSSWQMVVHAADDPKQIVAEAQKRTVAKSQRYEGLLQVFDAKGKVSDKRWTLDRIGAHGDSKMVLRFTAPA